jgi:hypothetical protein
MVFSTCFGHRKCKFENGLLITDNNKIEIESIAELGSVKIRAQGSISILGGLLLWMAWLMFLSPGETSDTTGLFFGLFAVACVTWAFIIAWKVLPYEYGFKINYMTSLYLDKSETEAYETIKSYIKTKNGGAG